MPEARRVGVFGGTFDPVHIGHLAVAQDALEVLRLDRILFVPAARSPLKPDPPRAEGAVRARMLREAVAGDSRFEVCDLELHRAAPSYMVETLTQLHDELPGCQLVLLLGADQWAGFGRWRRPREIAHLSELAVLARSGEHPAEVDPGLGTGVPLPFTEVPVTRVDLSSTRIRRRVSEGRSSRYLVPEAVRRIIEGEKLYLSEL
jgi:nicotinate-nucleotide adenylyltransferase